MIEVLGGEEVALFRSEEGPRKIRAVVDRGVAVGVPIVGVVSSVAADDYVEWGRVAAALQRASGVVPVVLAVTGACHGGTALLLGLADVVVMTADAVATVGSPAAVREITGRSLSAAELGGSGVHRTMSGLAALTVDDEPSALEAVIHVLCFLPSNNMSTPTVWPTDDSVERRCDIAAAAVPAASGASYDVRKVVCDVVDDAELLELWPDHAANVVTGFATVDGRPVGVVANQPSVLAGTLDVAASSKAARFVQLCDAFNVSLLTFVDTPGFQPGKDQEWRGMIRHGAELVHAYAAATVPRVCVVLRKAYGGAYIVMDSKGVGSDHCIAWPQAEMAVMGAAGAVEILYARKGELSAEERARLEAEYKARHCTPQPAFDRGFVDEIVAPEATRAAVAAALWSLRNKRDEHPRRKHSNSPL